jgi:fructosamine-3-kinase
MLNMTERPDKGREAEVTTLNYLAANSNIPVPKVLHDWVDRNGRYFVLEQAWSSLSQS